MSEFETVSESELQSIEGGIAGLLLLGAGAFGVGVAVGYALVKCGVV